MIKQTINTQIQDPNQDSLYSQLSLNGHFLKMDSSCWSLPVFQSFYCNLTPYKTDASQRRTDNGHFEIVNGHLKTE